MKEGYETIKKEVKWPKRTILKKDSLKQFELYMGYIITVGILYLLSR